MGSRSSGHRSALRHHARPCLDRRWPRNRLRGWRRCVPEPLAGLRFRTADAQTPALRASSRLLPRDCPHAAPPRLHLVDLQREPLASGHPHRGAQDAHRLDLRQPHSRSTRRTAARSHFNPTGAGTSRSGPATRTGRTVSSSPPSAGRSAARRAGRRIADGWPWIPVSEGQSEIYVMAADGGTPRRMTTSRGGSTMPSRAGRATARGSTSPPTAVAAGRSGRRRGGQAGAGAEAVQVTRSGGGAPQVSPDGKYITT